MPRREEQLVPFIRQSTLGMRLCRPDAAAYRQHQRCEYPGNGTSSSLRWQPEFISGIVAPPGVIARCFIRRRIPEAVPRKVGSRKGVMAKEKRYLAQNGG